MNAGELVFSQIIGHLPMHTFRRCVTRIKEIAWQSGPF